MWYPLEQALRGHPSVWYRTVSANYIQDLTQVVHTYFIPYKPFTRILISDHLFNTIRLLAIPLLSKVTVRLRGAV